MRALGERSGAPRSPRPRVDRPRPACRYFRAILDAADKTAELAVKTARKSRRKLLVALALSQLAAGQVRLQRGDAALRNAIGGRTSLRGGQATSCIVAARYGPSLAPKTSWATRRKASAQPTKLSHSRGEPATAGARPRRSTSAGGQHVDLAKRLRGLHQALAGYVASGHVSGQAAIYNNLALAYRALGLYRHSNRMAHRAIEIRRRLHDFDGAGERADDRRGQRHARGECGVRAPALRRHRGHLPPAGRERRSPLETPPCRG